MDRFAPAPFTPSPSGWSRFELRRQGLTPVYVGKEAKKSADIKLPSFSGGRKRDVLFFTQELSTLLSAGVPVDRALSITAELTDRASFRALVLDILRVLKGGRTLADSLATHPEPFLRPVYQYGPRRRSRRIAGGGFRAALRIRAHARRSAQLHHLLDGLPDAAVAGGHRLHSGADEFRRAAIRIGV